MLKEKTMRKNKLFFIIVIFIICFTNYSYAAIGGVKIYPIRINFKSKSGESETAIINVINQREKSVTMEIENQDFCRDSLGNLINVDEGTLKRGCSKFLTISPRKFNLEPNEEATVRITIDMPDGSNGTYWTQLIFNEVSKQQSIKKDQGGGRIIQVFLDYRWEVSIFQTVPGSQIIDGEITVVQINLSEKLQPNIELEFINTGNIILMNCNGYIEIRDELGNTVEELNINKFNVYPDGKRIIKTEIPQTLKPGEYSALAVIDFGGDHLVAGEAFFEISSDSSSEE